MVRPLLNLQTMLPLSIGVHLVVCPILQSSKNFTASVIGLGSQVTTAQAVISLQVPTATPSSSLLRATAAMMTSTLMVRTASIGHVRSSRTVPTAPVTSTSSVATSTRRTTSTVTSGSLSARSQKNKVGALPTALCQHGGEVLNIISPSSWQT